ncbi:MAG: phosphoribosyl-AMP cyclohydrolase [Gammaproteobacteria bacterium]|jgi:phosphoribosyl-AMP cyclohydrolase|nr:phosphoribosyl-AMP cyclohydrolase [Gammaproteobacteria bacterium]MDC0186318.1 phosphoribosyl-AMP cyclohydrolase [Gammaproteobacteria bacterium]|tara:strand:- start:206 stop:706 length:501 start_codon:yes stop_codon:yes gene_type:complete
MLKEDSEVHELNTKVLFSKRLSIEQVEEGNDLAPKFNGDGLIPVVTTDFESGELLMHGYMSDQSLKLSIETNEMYYFSRSRKQIWHKGATSGFIQKIQTLLIDDDQDAIWARVNVSGGASCHVGYRSCFYREIKNNNQEVSLEFTELEKVFDPEEVYPDVDNPTKL